MDSKFSRHRIRGADVVPLRPSPSGDMRDYSSFFYLDYARLVRNVAFDRKHVVVDGDLGRLDLIAYKYYNDINLWWYVAFSNGIVNPFTDMYVGQVLQIAAMTSLADVFRNHGAVSSSPSVRLP